MIGIECPECCCLAFVTDPKSVVGIRRADTAGCVRLVSDGLMLTCCYCGETWKMLDDMGYDADLPTIIDVMESARMKDSSVCIKLSPSLFTDGKFPPGPLIDANGKQVMLCGYPVVVTDKVSTQKWVIGGPFSVDFELECQDDDECKPR